MNRITFFLLLLIGGLQYRLWFGDGNVLEFQRMNDRIAELRQEGARRSERNVALEAEVMDLKQGLDAVEERARLDLGMVKDGEAFVQVIDPRHEQDEEAPAPTTPANPPAKEPRNREESPKKPKPADAAPAAPAAVGKKPTAATPAKPVAKPKKPAAKPKPKPAPRPAAAAPPPQEDLKP